MTLYVGTSGWAYREWKPSFYPQGVPRSRFLDHYSSRLTACEINATFYRLQSETTVSRWARATPEGFRFAAKAHRGLTHSRGLASGGLQPDFLKAFFESLKPLEERVGVVLFQFPRYRKRDDATLDTLLMSLPNDLAYAFEFRHDSWRAPEVDARVAPRGTVVVSDTAGDAPTELPPGPIGYVRLRADRYDIAQRDAWRRLLEAEGRKRDVYAFAKHEGVAAGDPFTGVGLAQWLIDTTTPVRVDG